ncbi:Alpha/Beta hydrolase protein [Podospora appendiculata]|uniref:Alpha/Beta hydrolase protein n=1 Tax=Podospora appendiculata TaxID=314037 RepID=A0AAE0XHM0_9PEZI|nr:Alpha/Beta hydrolase protein [Podospora appendiculata]
MASSNTWSFTPLVADLPPTLFPNVTFWNVTNSATNLVYQVQISWPFEWESRQVNKSALTMYVLDGNALGMTASDAFKRRKAVEPSQPDSIVVSIGYPLTDSVYAWGQRAIDFAPRTTPSGVDDFLGFITETLRPWVRATMFPNVEFSRDALFGHSMGGLFVLHTLIHHAELFDTFMAASPGFFYEGGAILDDVSRYLGSAGDSGIDGAGEVTKPAVLVTYGTLEQFPERWRTETEVQFQARREGIRQYRNTEFCHELFDRLRASGKMRDVRVKEYVGADHSGVPASTIVDGIMYFADW